MIELEKYDDFVNVDCAAGYYEIHITVMCYLKDIEKFKQHCKNINAKTIIINLTSGENQIMTSKTCKVTPKELANIIHNDLRELTPHFLISRIKVECSPCNPILEHVDDSYMETHLPCKPVSDMKSVTDNLIGDYHISKNYFKDDIRMITSRVYNISYHDFALMVQKDIDALKAQGLIYNNYKMEIEHCILDTNSTIDNKWMGK